MKKLVFFLMMVWIANPFFAQTQKSDNFLNLGVGFQHGTGVNISYDHRILTFNEHSALTVGGYLGLLRGDGYALTGSHGKIDNWDYKWLLSPRFTYVYPLNQHFDLYVALMPGLLIDNKYHKEKVKYEFFTGVTGGGRVKIIKNLSLFAEAGYSLLYLNGGLSFTF